MGFEYKILVDLTEQQSLELQCLILELPNFSRKPYEENNFIEFRHSDNVNLQWMPNLRLLFESDGIYICNHSTLAIWDDIKVIKYYLDINHLTYRIFDYSD